MVTQIIKRDGRIINYNEDKIASAIFKAAMTAAKKEGRTAEINSTSFLTISIYFKKLYINLSTSFGKDNYNICYDQIIFE